MVLEIINELQAELCRGMSTADGEAVESTARHLEAMGFDHFDAVAALAEPGPLALGRAGADEADEIAATATFLLGDDASFLTGQAIIVDGGQIACQDNGRMMQAPDMS